MRFSVIIPLYNKAPYVKKAIESVYCQTLRDFELIVIDDGSSDNSLSVAREALRDTDIVFQLMHQENAGVSIARNKGVAVSQGDYICFLDADDWWAPTFLERMNWMIKQYPEAGIYGSNYFYVKNGRPKVFETIADTGYINYCRVYSEALHMPLWTGAICLPRSVFDEMKGFRPHLKLGEDFDLWIRIAFKYKVAFLNEPLSFYFQDSNSNWRLVGKLHDPKFHMLWNLDYLEEKEKTDPDYKRLIDGLRTYGLLPYYLSKKYRETAKNELAKVDWSKQPSKTRSLYSTPIPILKCRMFIMKCGSRVKQAIVKLI